MAKPTDPQLKKWLPGAVGISGLRLISVGHVGGEGEDVMDFHFPRCSMKNPITPSACSHGFASHADGASHHPGEVGIVFVLLRRNKNVCSRSGIPIPRSNHYSPLPSHAGVVKEFKKIMVAP